MKSLPLIVISFLLGAGVSSYLSNDTRSAEYKVDLPEEIQIAKVGDSLEVYSVSEGVIYIGFKH